MKRILTMTTDTITDGDKLAARITDELAHFTAKWQTARTDVRAKLAKDLLAGHRVDRDRFEHAAKVEAFAAVAEHVGQWTTPELLGSYATDRMMDSPDPDARTAWANVLRITLGKW